ncbi:MAG: hypothetical protein WC580_07045 [Agrococcus sp.]
MARERASLASGTLARAALALVGVLVALPILLVATTMVVLESRLTADAAGPAVPAPAADYARSFSMTVRDGERTIRLWLEDLDGLPSFRQTIEVDGQPVSDQIYRGDERTLDTREAESGLAWSRVEDVAPEDVQLSGLAAGPAAWALEYGLGDHQVDAGSGTLDITVHSVEEDIPAEVFQLPPGAEPAPAE